MAIGPKDFGRFLSLAKRHLKKLVPDVIAKDPRVGWTLFGASAAAPIVGYELHRRVHPVVDDEPDMRMAEQAIHEALGKQSDLSSVIGTEVAEQTIIRGLNAMRKSVRDAKDRMPGLPELPTPRRGFTSRSEEESREEGDTLPEPDRPATTRKRMP